LEASQGVQLPNPHATPARPTRPAPDPHPPSGATPPTYPPTQTTSNRPVGEAEEERRSSSASDRPHPRGWCRPPCCGRNSSSTPGVPETTRVTSAPHAPACQPSPGLGSP